MEAQTIRLKSTVQNRGNKSSPFKGNRSEWSKRSPFKRKSLRVEEENSHLKGTVQRRGHTSSFTENIHNGARARHLKEAVKNAGTW
jgi:hypothetical protein